MPDQNNPAPDGGGDVAARLAFVETESKKAFTARDEARAKAAAAEAAAESAKGEIAKLQAQIADANKRFGDYDAIKTERDRLNAENGEMKKFAEAFVASRKDQIPKETIEALAGVDPVRQMMIVNTFPTKVAPAAPPAVPPGSQPTGDAEFVAVRNLPPAERQKAISRMDVKRRGEFYEFLGGARAVLGQ